MRAIGASARHVLPPVDPCHEEPKMNEIAVIAARTFWTRGQTAALVALQNSPGERRGGH